MYGKIKVGKLYMDQNPRIASRYQIMGVPTFVLFHSGEIIRQRTGAQSKGQLVQMLGEVLMGEGTMERGKWKGEERREGDKVRERGMEGG